MAGRDSVAQNCFGVTMNDEPMDLDALRATDEESDAQAGRRMGIAGVIVTAFLVLGKFMGLGKEMLISNLGASASTDAFKVAYNSVIYTIYTKVEKLLRPTYLPEFVKTRREEGEAQAWLVGSVMMGFQFILLSILALVCVVFARPILLFVGKGLAESPNGLDQAVAMLRIMAPALLLFSLSVMPELTLHAYKRFTVPAVAEAAFRFAVVVVAGALIYFAWPYRPEDAIYAVATGVLVGGCLRFLLQLPALWGKLRMVRLTANVLANPGARTILALMPPVLLGVVFSAMRTWADSRFSTQIEPGAYTSLDLGRKIPDLFLQTLPLAVSFVVYPYLSEWAIRGEKDKMADALVRVSRAMAFLFVPTAVALMILRLPVINLLYTHGEFTAQDAELSAVGVYWYSSGMLFFSVEGSINKWFFAFKDTMTPNVAGALFAVLHVFIGYMGVYRLGGTVRSKLSWVAAALTISKSAKVIALYGLLRQRIGRIEWAHLGAFTLKLAACVGLMSVVLWLLQQNLTPSLEVWQAGRKLKALASLGAGFTVGAGSFLGMAALMRIEELTMVIEFLVKAIGKLRRKSRPSGD